MIKGTQASWGKENCLLISMSVALVSFNSSFFRMIKWIYHTMLKTIFAIRN